MSRPQECKWDALRTTTSERRDVFGDGAYDGSDQRGIIRLPLQILRTFLHVCHKISFMFSGVSRTPNHLESVPRAYKRVFVERRLVSLGAVEAIRAALERAGIEFIDENGGGEGLRLRKPRHPKRK